MKQINTKIRQNKQYKQRDNRKNNYGQIKDNSIFQKLDRY